MNKRFSILAALLPGLLVAACSTTPSLEAALPEDIQGQSRAITYDALRVSLVAPSAGQLWSDIEGSGAAAAEGAQMMLAAPLGCLQGGLFAGMCMAMAPFFPIIAAARAEKPEVTRAALEDLDGTVANYGLKEKLELELFGRIAAEGLPLADDSTAESTGTTIGLSVVIPAIELEHSGYKNGSITVSVPYSILLTDSDGNVLMRRSKRLSYRLDHDDGAATLYPLLDEWVTDIAEHAVDEVLLEWQPAVRLENVYPVIEEKRSWLGLRYTAWAPVDSVTPTLVWQALPAETLAEAADVSYEIVVFGYVRSSYDTYWKRREILEVRDLPDPRYRFETALRECQRYYWEPRARFRYRDNVHTTSLDKAYMLITPGPNCRNPSWLLAENDVPDTEWLLRGGAAD